MNTTLLDRVNGSLVALGLSERTASLLENSVILAGIVIAALLLLWVGRRAIPLIQRLVNRTAITWDDALLSQPLMRRLIAILPWILTYILLPQAFRGEPTIQKVLLRACTIAIVCYATAYLSALMATIFALVEGRRSMHGRPMRGVLQVFQIMLIVVAIIVIIGIVIQRSPLTLLAGLGASAALLMLIFKDTITGLVSGVQLSANDMLKPGDWITMPKYDADGTVIDVTLNTVKVRNFDNTITMIPPYALTSDSFQNWRGMEESAGRRIKRSVSVEMNSVRFCTPEMLDKFRKMKLLTQYIDDKQAEIEKWNAAHNADPATIDARHQTNLGVLRAYLLRYLQSLPDVNPQMTCMVRQLQPTETGIPIELYCFSRLKDSAGYEALQADIMDHVLSVIGEFDLYVFQTPSGRDMLATGSTAGPAPTSATKAARAAKSKAAVLKPLTNQPLGA